MKLFIGLDLVACIEKVNFLIHLDHFALIKAYIISQMQSSQLSLDFHVRVNVWFMCCPKSKLEDGEGQNMETQNQCNRCKNIRNSRFSDGTIRTENIVAI